MILCRSLPVGECWLQRMNLDRVLSLYPGQDCRRIDLMIGDKQYWNRGIGTGVIGMLASYAFECEEVDVIHIPDVASHNAGSIRAFQKAGFGVVLRQQLPSGRKASCTFDLALSRQQFWAMRRAGV